MDDEAPRLFTGRLELIAATPSLARAAATSSQALAKLLECEVPPGWPPELMRDHQEAWAAQLETDPELAGWSAWYIVQVTPAVLVGSIGFVGRARCRAAWSSAATALVAASTSARATRRRRWAGSSTGRSRSTRCGASAPTPIAHLAASIRVLEKNGLSHVGDGDEPGTIRFELRRP